MSIELLAALLKSGIDFAKAAKKLTGDGAKASGPVAKILKCFERLEKLDPIAYDDMRSELEEINDHCQTLKKDKEFMKGPMGKIVDNIQAETQKRLKDVKKKEKHEDEKGAAQGLVERDIVVTVLDFRGELMSGFPVEIDVDTVVDGRTKRATLKAKVSRGYVKFKGVQLAEEGSFVFAAVYGKTKPTGGGNWKNLGKKGLVVTAQQKAGELELQGRALMRFTAGFEAKFGIKLATPDLLKVIGPQGEVTGEVGTKLEAVAEFENSIKGTVMFPTNTFEISF